MTMSRRPVRFRHVVSIGAVAWACAVGAEATSAQATQQFPGDPVAGRKIFVERRCARCHAIWGNGGTLGPDFATVGAGRSLQQLAGMFWNHTPKMIETVRERGFDWPTFTEAELADIISYVYYVKLFDRPGDPGLGRRWYREMHCLDCHAVGGTGGDIAPALDSYARYIAPIALAQGMWNHGPTMQAQQTARGVPMPMFLGREIADLQAFIREESNLRGRDVVLLQPPDPNRGRRLFATKQCVPCHGPGGRGTELGPDLRGATERLSVSEIAGQLWNHSSQMAAAISARGLEFPQFRGAEMADVIAFLYYIRFYETGGNVRIGERLFVDKGCVTCHTRDGTPLVGPDLSASEVVLTLLGLATSMWDHAPAMYDQMQLAEAEWPRFEGNEMRDLSAFLRSLASRGRRDEQ